MIQIDWKPDERKLRQFALIFLAGFGIIGCLAALKLESPYIGPIWIPGMLWGLGLLVGMCGLLFPPLVRPVYLAWMAAAFPLGWVMSHLFLALVFFGLFTPVSLFFRLLGRDPLNRIGKAKESYWVCRPEPPPAKRYFNQF